jgi:hypothetical protein
MQACPASSAAMHSWMLEPDQLDVYVSPATVTVPLQARSMGVPLDVHVHVSPLGVMITGAAPPLGPAPLHE